MQQTAIAALLRSVQEHPADGSGAAGVERTNSSKVPWLVVGPDGIELAIAHKIRVGCPSSSTDQDTSNLPTVRPPHTVGCKQKHSKGNACLVAAPVAAPVAVCCGALLSIRQSLVHH